MPHFPGEHQSTSANGFLLKYALSCSAASVAETVTYPLDITKTRLQVFPSDEKRRRGMFRVTYNIARREGMLSLWQGLAPAVYRHFVYTGIRTGLYELIRNKWHRPEEGARFKVWKSLVAGLTSGAVAQFAASPADLVKVQMQMEGLRKLQNLPPRFRSTWHAFVCVYRQNGFRGLWIGWIPNCQRAALLNMADLATYDNAKHWILRNTQWKDGPVTHICASACSGLMAAIVSTPADVVKTRIMDQLRHTHDNNSGQRLPQVYKGSVDCLMRIVRHEGVLSLYRGFIPTYVRMAPWSLTFWVSYEKIRALVGAPGF
ncbi:CBN-UCP-4 protein [Aphelenchoides avenae]|nr:CBN-UCP-4 protein [Aphelenchus avenae]